MNLHDHAPVLMHRVFIKIISNVGFPLILFLPTSGDSALVVRTSKEPYKKFLELHKLYFPKGLTKD